MLLASTPSYLVGTLELLYIYIYTIRPQSRSNMLWSLWWQVPTVAIGMSRHQHWVSRKSKHPQSCQIFHQRVFSVACEQICQLSEVFRLLSLYLSSVFPNQHKPWSTTLRCLFHQFIKQWINSGLHYLWTLNLSRRLRPSAGEPLWRQSN